MVRATDTRITNDRGYALVQVRGLCMVVRAFLIVACLPIFPCSPLLAHRSLALRAGQ